MGKLLRVDLSTGAAWEDPLPPEAVLRQFIGGAGLGGKLLYEEVPPTVQPLDAESWVYFMSGPLGGTPAPGSNDVTAVSLNYETGYTMATSHSHGFFGSFIRFAGYDGIAIRGISPRPVYLLAFDGQAELRDAEHLWGQEIFDTEDRIKAETGLGESISVAAIGPAGENLVHGAAIINDRTHTMAKGGVAAILGSKRLKAVAVGGKRPVPVAAPLEFLQIAERWRRLLWRRDPVPGQDHVEVGRDPRNIGVRRNHFEKNVLGRNSASAAKNFLSPAFADVAWDHWVREGQQFKSTSVGCFSCSRGCGHMVEITTGPFKGHKVIRPSGGEHVDAQWMVGIVDAGSVAWVAERYAKLGMDSNTVGSCIGLAIECYERGLLDKARTGGLELTWGNVEAISALLDQIAHRRGFGGEFLADGPRAAAERIGGDAPQYVVHIKGTGMNLHDWRAAWGTLLAEIVANVGPCWQGYRVDFRREPDLGFDKLGDPFEVESKPLEVRQTSMRKLWEDCLGICWFNASRDTPGTLPLVPQALAAATGWEGFDVEEALRVGERVSNLQRVFNFRRGFTAAMDLDVSPRVLEAPPDGLAAGKSIAPHLPDMIKQYYSLMGWDPATGKPTRETLERLGLAALASEL